MTAAVILLLVCQQLLDPTRAAQAAEMLSKARTVAEADSTHDRTAQMNREFAERFNRLVRALKDFETAYARDHGQVWPAKEAAHLDVAMRELSQSPGWRRPN